jgi:hypothetical protein
MDVAYDQIQEEQFPDDDRSQSNSEQKQRRSSDLNQDLTDTYKAISNSPWAVRLGGLWGTVRKQVSSYLFFLCALVQYGC